MPGENIMDWSPTAINNGTADSLIDYHEGQTRASLNNAGRGVMAALAKQRNLLNGSITTGGTANAQTFTSGVTYTSVPTGLVVRLLVGAGLTNTSSMTLNMDGIGAVTVKNMSAVNLTQGEWVGGNYVSVLYNGTSWVLLNSSFAGTAVTFTPSNPTGTLSTVGVMMGLGSTCMLTPTRSSRALVTVTGTIANSVGAGAVAQVRVGTGAAPANGAAAAGTQVGGTPGVLASSGGGSPYCQSVVFTSLSIGTTYWIDLLLAAVTGGTASISSLTLATVEV